jgi:hypothetical protein
LTLNVEKIRADAPARSSDRHMGQVTIAYSMTEISPVSFQSSTADPVQKWVSTVGRPAAYRGQDRDREVPHHAVWHAFGRPSSARTMSSSPRRRKFEPGITVGVGVAVVLAVFLPLEHSDEH